ncbi:sigma-54-dependent Fis family transcriptional regulator [Luteithermobacter gelatinilyticus]|uniref:sigma-54-dependent Fis family transcriptional regulator n=1 Tax=Luteithermobacter gelatinilyticus TaxID=2582913 RepID=UPI001AEFEE4F|nr:sigma-54-dependent Fis family transcriptional regulator [Luteithermobacter gelatinilyticus]
MTTTLKYAGKTALGQLEDLSDKIELIPELPDFKDLSARLKFSPKEGRIWLDDMRMMMLHATSLGALRNEMIESLGVDKARALLTRMGYVSGAKDAELAAKLRGGEDFFDVFAVGPQLHSLEGIVNVEPVRLEADTEKGHYYGEFLWHDSIEDEAHIESYGIGADPVCWMQIGYASGYTSVFMGRPIFYKEVECRGMGHSHCRIIGKPVSEWNDIDEDLAFMQPQAFANAQTIRTAQNPSHRVMAPEEVPISSPLSGAMSTDMVGASAAFNVACHMLSKVAETDATVLFLGESGVGKEMFASTLQKISKRAKEPYVAVNCAAIPENLLEAELFGVEKGAFTGAIESRPGRFERADTGTIFLDEIGTLSLSAQGKLLRVLQEHQVERVGSKKTTHVDIRVIAATNVDLKSEVKAGRFREDLYFRLNVFPIHIPPLRDRKADIPLLMNHFLQKYSKKYGKSIKGFTSRAIDGFLNYDWPGNIRELENLVERGVILAPDDGAIDLNHLFTCGEDFSISMLGLNRDGSLNATAEDCLGAYGMSGQNYREIADHIVEQNVSLEVLERQILQAAVDKADGNLSAAARSLGITRPQLAYRLKKI